MAQEAHDPGGKDGWTGRQMRALDAAVATLQQHKRAMAVVGWARSYRGATRAGEEAAILGGLFTAMADALAAFDTAGET